MGCKLKWYPKFYKHILSFFAFIKTMVTFINWLVQLFKSTEGQILFIIIWDVDKFIVNFLSF